MCCPNRKVPAYIVLFLSALGIIAGIVMIYFSVKINNSEILDELQNVEEIKKNFDMESIRKYVFLGLLLFALVVLVASVMGILACKINHRCYTMCFGIILLPTWIVIFIVGAVASIAANTGPEVFTEQCNLAIEKMN